MNIYKIIRENACTARLNARNKVDCLRKLATLMAASIESVSEDEIYDSLLEREKLGSTGFEDGVAIPHAKIKGLSEFYMGIALSSKGIDFDNIDGKRAHLFFTVLGPESQTEGHLQVLAQISRISRIQKARKEMLRAHSGTALKENFLRYTTLSPREVAEKGKQKLLIIVLNEKRYLDDIMNLFLEKGILGANVFNSSSIKSQLTNIPLFSDFLDFLKERQDINKTIMALIYESDLADIVDGIEQMLGDLDTHTGAMICALDISYLKGTLQI